MSKYFPVTAGLEMFICVHNIYIYIHIHNIHYVYVLTPLTPSVAIYFVLPQTKDMRFSSTGHSKLPKGVNVSMNSCSSLCVCQPVTALD